MAERGASCDEYEVSEPRVPHIWPGFGQINEWWGEWRLILKISGSSAVLPDLRVGAPIAWRGEDGLIRYNVVNLTTLFWFGGRWKRPFRLRKPIESSRNYC